MEVVEYEYSVGTSEGCHESRFQVPRSIKYFDHRDTLDASMLAEDYYDNHDGWEASWPAELRVYEVRDGVVSEVSRFDVDMESRPYFMAHRNSQ